MNVRRFETPAAVAKKLAEYAPRKCSNLLDPSVGGGALIAPLVKRIQREDIAVYCIDVDAEAILDLKNNFIREKNFSPKCINEDFLRWANLRRRPRFDCIVMNPPFAAAQTSLRREQICEINLGSSYASKAMPVEAAFVCRAIDLLTDDGRLLAVLPTSIVMSESLEWIRSYMLELGAIRSVHELPAGTFPNVESRMYLLVFDKGAKQRKITLFNHDLNEPHKMDLMIKPGELLGRLDYGYNHSKKVAEQLINRREALNWQKLADIVSIKRGNVKSPITASDVIHTCDFEHGYWRRPRPYRLEGSWKRIDSIRKTDILLQRVGRGCYQRVGRYASSSQARISDCMFVLRPKKQESFYEILFALKVMTRFRWLKPLLERGTGANYISIRSAGDLFLPMGLSKSYPAAFDAFVLGDKQRSGNWQKFANSVAKDLATVLA